MAGLIALGIVAVLVTVAAALKTSGDGDNRDDRYRGW